jgi:hypothetical protein
MNFHDLNPDALNSTELDEACQIALTRSAIINSTLNPEFVVELLQGTTRQKRDGLWQIKGATRLRHRQHRLNQAAARRPRMTVGEPPRRGTVPASRRAKLAERSERDRARTFVTKGGTHKR